MMEVVNMTSVVVPVPVDNEIVNLTPHEVTVCDGQGNVIARLPSKGTVRLSEEVRKVGEVNGVPLLRVTYGNPVVSGVNPDELKGKVIIVSGMVGTQEAREIAEKYGVKAVIAPYTGTHSEYGPVREGGRVKCVRAFRLIYGSL